MTGSWPADRARIAVTPAGCAAELRLAYQSTGGSISDDELCQLLRQRSDQPISLLARWIVHRCIVHFDWRHETWLPLFQFDLATKEVRDGVQETVAELREVFDDLELAQWFARSNNWLDGMPPCEVIGANPARVHEVARADRFVAAG